MAVIATGGREIGIVCRLQGVHIEVLMAVVVVALGRVVVPLDARTQERRQGRTAYPQEVNRTQHHGHHLSHLTHRLLFV